MERISGPYKGRFIAAYTVAKGESFVGYAKICVNAPGSVWSAGPVEKLTSASGCRSELEAVLAAERKARQEIAHMRGGSGPWSSFASLS